MTSGSAAVAGTSLGFSFTPSGKSLSAIMIAVSVVVFASARLTSKHT